MVPKVRFLPYSEADGPHNMAADEALLKSAAERASLRFYGWTKPTLSLGYFQREQVRLTDATLASLPFVRRPSGGDTLVHHYEVTYALELPPGPPWQCGESWLQRMHQIIERALRKLKVACKLHAAGNEPVPTGPLCFRHLTPGDVLLGSAKIVGSAQRRQRGALMQHGAILLAASPFTPSLPAIKELTGKTVSANDVVMTVTRAFAEQTEWELTAEEWSCPEQELIDELVASKYSQQAWNCKR